MRRATLLESIGIPIYAQIAPSILESISSMKKRIGDFFADRGLLTETQVQEVVRHSSRTGLRFGEAAVDLGLLDHEDLIELFGPHNTVDFYTLEPEHLPEATRGLIPLDEMVERGVLALGFKQEGSLFGASKTCLNLGVLEPSPEKVEELKHWALSRFAKDGVASIRAFLLLPDHFLAALDRVYGLPEDSIRRRFAPDRIDRTLQMYLEE